MKRFSALLMLLLMLLVVSGCAADEVSVQSAISIDEGGALTQRVTVEGLPEESAIGDGLDEGGWAVESTSSPLVVTKKYASAAQVETSEPMLVSAILGAIEKPLGYRPEVVSEPWASVKVQDFKLARRIQVSYSPTVIDFEPPYCVDCRGAGDGICASCEGDGAVVCPTCRGAKRTQCDGCAGKGYLVCTSCEGRGFETCTSCEGKGASDCWYCDAVGWTECSSCDGTGQYEDWWTGATSKCTSCGGDGKRACDSCDGDGQEDCSSCDGDGKYECGSCDADGKQECSACQEAGTIACPNCEALGTLECRDCGATGDSSCDSCDGSGSATEPQLAAYESGLQDARISFAVEMPGIRKPGQSARAPWDYSGTELMDSDVMTLESWIPNWPILGSSIAVLVALLAAAGWLGWRRLASAMAARRPAPSTVTPGVAQQVATASASAEPATSPGNGDMVADLRFCVGCGGQLRPGAEFCPTCGRPAGGPAATLPGQNAEDRG